MTARDRFLAAGFSKFMAHGYDGTGLAAILAEAGLSKGALYHHFESKAALFEEVIAHYFPSPFTGMDWPAHAALSVQGQRAAIASFTGSSSRWAWKAAKAPCGISPCFLTLCRGFRPIRPKIGALYARLIDALAEAMVREDGVSAGEAGQRARAFVAGFEGEFYLWAVTGRSPLIKSED